MDQFTNNLTGAAFCDQNGKVILKKNDSGKVFFVSASPSAIYRSGYVSDKAASIISEKMKEGAKLKNVISTFLDFAVISYTDEQGEEHSAPTLMPKASGEVLYSEDDWE